MADIEWVATPPPAVGVREHVRWPEIAEQLRSRPGEWALVKRKCKDASSATRLKQGTAAGFAPAGAFDARAVRQDTRNYDLYARYVGEVSA